MTDAVTALVNLETAIANLNSVLQGSSGESVTIGGVSKPTISKAIADAYAGISALVSGHLAYETKALMDAAGAPPAGELAEVWKDTTPANNGVYGYTGGAWVLSEYYNLALARVIGLADALKRNNEEIFTRGLNMYDKTVAGTPDYYLNASGAEISAVGSWTITEYMPAFEGMVYAYQGFFGAGTTGICCYDKDFVLIGVMTRPTTNAGTVTTLPLTAYIRVSLRPADKAAFMMEIGSSQSTYEAYSLGAIKLNLLPDLSEAIVYGFPQIDNGELFTQGKNLFNENRTGTVDFYLDGSGVETAAATWMISDYIPIDAGIEYAYQGFHGIGTARFCTYDIQLNLLEVLDSVADANTGTFTAGAGAFFVRFSMLAANKGAFMLEVGSSQTAHEDYSGVMHDYLMPYGVSNITHYARASGDEILDRSVNLYDKNQTHTVDFYLSESGVVTAGGTWRITDYIPIFESYDYAFQGYWAAGTTSFCTYDKDLNLLEVFTTTGDDFGTFTAGRGAVYVRFSLRITTDTNRFMLEYGVTQSTYEAYSVVVKPELIPTMADFSAVNIAVFGDSITQGTGNWPAQFEPIISPASLNNQGVSGQQYTWLDADPASSGITFWKSILAYQASAPTTPDAIIIALGTNDYTDPLGSYADAFAQSEATTTHLTMAGAMRKALFKLQTDYPDAQIFCCTPISRDGQYPTLLAIADIMKAICNRMSIKVIDCLHLSGINEEFEPGRYTTDGVHPILAGQVVQGRCIAKEFEKLYYFDS